MLKKLGWFNLLLLPVAFISQLVILAGVGILLRAGTGSLDNSDHLPVTPGLYLILIDTDQYAQNVSEEAYKGLPDSHDFSKQKDFFALFPALYCSGSKDGDKYEADYCSSWGKQLFDLQRLWRVWGVDLIHDNLIASNPTLIYAGLLTTAASTGLSLITGLISFCSSWMGILSATLSWISTIAAIATSALSYTFVSRLASHISRLETSGSGQLVPHWGNVYLRSTWIGTGLALFAAFILTITSWTRRKTRSRNKKIQSQSQFPLMGVVRRATNAFGGQSSSYRHLEETRDGSAPEKHTSRSPSVELIGPRSSSHEHNFETSTAYEPMRHRSVG